ncbi:hypothetical protein DYST_03366 [Dyella terrae]|nr:hypothetical protein DYST_03366 [Dyella terrae]
MLCFLAEITHGVLHATGRGQAVALDRLVVQLHRGEDRPPALDTVVVADVLLLQHQPARVIGSWHHLLQRLAVGILARAHQRGQQEQLAKEIGLGLELDRGRAQHLLRTGNGLLDFVGLPLDLVWQRRKRTEHPHHVVALAHPPQSWPGLHATDGDRIQVDGCGRRRRCGCTRRLSENRCACRENKCSG